MHIESEKLVAILDSIEDGVFVIDRNYTIEFMNTAMVKIFGEGVGEKCHEVIFHQNDICTWCKVEEVCRQGVTNQFEKHINHFDKTYSITEKPLHNPDGSVSKLTIYRDITHLKEREKELRASEQYYKSLFEHVSCGVFVSSKEGKFLEANRALLHMLGYESKEEFFKIDIAKDLYLRSEDRKKFRGLIEREGRVIDWEVYFKRKDGTKIPVLLTGHGRYDEQGNIIGYEGLNVDQSQRKQMERELEKTRIQLLQAEKMASLGRLAAGVAHQLNNPLGGIILYTKLVMEDYNLEESALEDLNRILKDAERCRDTVKELLEFSRQKRYLMQPCDINQAISRTLFLLENQTLFQNVSIEKDMASSLPSVMADIQQLNHVFMNVILNAADAMEGKGKLTVKTGFIPDRDLVCVEVSDTGPGIPDEILPRIFDPFYTTKEEGKGTGLGLSLAYSIAEKHGGVIKAENNTDSGATFIIELPLKHDQPEGTKPDR
jgi:PAS domain S-box-containing protein